MVALASSSLPPERGRSGRDEFCLIVKSWEAGCLLGWRVTAGQPETRTGERQQPRSGGSGVRGQTAQSSPGQAPHLDLRNEWFPLQGLPTSSQAPGKHWALGWGGDLQLRITFKNLCRWLCLSSLLPKGQSHSRKFFTFLLL